MKQYRYLRTVITHLNADNYSTEGIRIEPKEYITSAVLGFNKEQYNAFFRTELDNDNLPEKYKQAIWCEKKLWKEVQHTLGIKSVDERYKTELIDSICLALMLQRRIYSVLEQDSKNMRLREIDTKMYLDKQQGEFADFIKATVKSEPKVMPSLVHTFISKNKMKRATESDVRKYYLYTFAFRLYHLLHHGYINVGEEITRPLSMTDKKSKSARVMAGRLLQAVHVIDVTDDDDAFEKWMIKKRKWFINYIPNANDYSDNNLMELITSSIFDSFKLSPEFIIAYLQFIFYAWLKKMHLKSVPKKV